MFLTLKKNCDFFLYKKPTLYFFLSIALLFVAHGLQMTLFPLLEAYHHLSLHSISYAALMQFFGFLIGTLVAPPIVRKMGYGHSYFFSLLLLGFTIFSFPFLNSTLSFFLNRLVLGFIMALIYANLDGWINEVSANTIRARAMGIFFIINFGFIMVGSLLLRIAPVESWTLPFLAVSIILLALLSCQKIKFSPQVSQTRAPSSFPLHIREAFVTLYKLSLARPLSILGIFVMGMATSPFWDLGPLFATTVPAKLDVSLFMMSTILGGVIGQYPLGKISDQIERRQTIGWAAFFGAIASILITFLPLANVSHASLYYLTGFIYGMCTFHLYMLSAAYVFDYVRAIGGSFIDISSWYLLVYALGSTTGNFFNFLVMLWTPTASLIFIPSILGNTLVFLCYQVQSSRETPLIQE